MYSVLCTEYSVLMKPRKSWHLILRVRSTVNPPHNDQNHNDYLDITIKICYPCKFVWGIVTEYSVVSPHWNNRKKGYLVIHTNRYIQVGFWKPSPLCTFRCQRSQLTINCPRFNVTSIKSRYFVSEVAANTGNVKED